MTDFSHVTHINYQNQLYPLGSHSVETFLTALEIDQDKLDLKVEGNTLYILAKTGTKGSCDFVDPIKQALENLNKPQAPQGPQEVKLVNGKLVPVTPEGEVDPIKQALEKLQQEVPQEVIQSRINYNEQTHGTLPQDTILELLKLIAK